MLVCLIGLGPAGAADHQEPKKKSDKIALVIGNGRYQHASALDNPVNDAMLIGKTLRGSGFAVTEIENVETTPMRRAIAEFGRAAQSAQIAMVYYAGHGIQVAGVNYLIPVDAQLTDELALDVEAIDARTLIAAVGGANTKIVVLDACRDNPFAARMRSIGGRSRGISRGLGRIETAGGGTLIAFSTSPDDLAQDGNGKNSPYAAALAHYLPVPDLDIQQVFNRVRAEVSRETENRQLPWENSSLFGDVFVGGQTTGGRPKDAAVDLETTAWADSGCRPGATQGCADYLKRFPEGRYRDVADYLVNNAETPLISKTEVIAVASDGTRVLTPLKGRKSLDSLGAGTVFRDCPDCPEMTVVPAGRFQMGSPASEDGRFDNEGPLHPVTLARAVAVQTRPITRADWQRYATETGDHPAGGCDLWNADRGDWVMRDASNWRDPGYPQTDQEPVVCVSWNEVQRYLGWLSSKAGYRYRLLSEAEYEYANRAGSAEPFPWSGGAGAICTYANIADAALKKAESAADTVACSDGFAHTSPVGHFPANVFGLSDMTGNVWSMTGDCWNDTYDGAPGDASTWNQGDCNQHVVRGGSWNFGPDKVRAAARAAVDSDLHTNLLGFRVARSD